MRNSNVEQSRDNTIITDHTNNHVEPIEPEHEYIDADVEMEANPAYQVIS